MQFGGKVDGNKFSTLCLLVILANVPQLHMNHAACRMLASCKIRK